MGPCVQVDQISNYRTQHDEQAEAYGRKPLPWQASPENHRVMDLSEHALSADGPFHFYGASFVHS